MNINILPSPSYGQIQLLLMPATSLGTLFEMVARLAVNGPLTVLDSGNCFQGYALARALKQQLGDFGSQDAFGKAMRGILLSRVFTCYQLETLLTEGQFGDAPILVLDFLATFYDQGVRVVERRRLLENCLARLQAVSRSAPVAVWIRQRSVIPQEGLAFLSMVRAACGQVFTATSLSALPAVQPRLFA